MRSGQGASQSARRILIISGDRRVSDELAETLELREGYVVTVVPAGRPGIDEAGGNRQDLVLLDLELPDMDGYGVCKVLRRVGMTKPIIMLSRSALDAEVILGFERGANDFVSLSSHSGILLARIRAQLRQLERSEAAEIVLGPYRFKPGAKLLVDCRDNSKTWLTPKEAALLKFLHQCDGRAVTQKEVLEGVWGYSAHAHTHTLTTHVYRLRQKIERDPARPSLLITTRDGYRLVAEEVRAHGARALQYAH